jgi:hypothetical protein
MIDENVDPSAMIMFLKTNRRLDGWIFVDQGFCVKNPWKIGERGKETELPRRKMSDLPILIQVLSRRILFASGRAPSDPGVHYNQAFWTLMT